MQDTSEDASWKTIPAAFPADIPLRRGDVTPEVSERVTTTDDAVGQSWDARGLPLTWPPPPPESLDQSVRTARSERGTCTVSPLSSCSSLQVLRPRPVHKIVITDTTCQAYEEEATCSAQEKSSKVSHASIPRYEKHTCRLATLIATLLLLSVIVARLASWRPSSNYVFSLSSNFGRVEGMRVFVRGGQPVIRYRGIPYALPPLGERRFRPSVLARRLGSLENCSHDLAITSMDGWHSCPQDGGPVPPWLLASSKEFSEDCLHLNLWTPDTTCMFQGRECGNRTVVVFLHGGDFRYTGNRAYDGAVLSSLGDVVVAIPNYRLGLLGCSVEPGSGEHLGIGDQLTALRWLQENVGLFGGNASSMTLMGHGAGAASVGHFMLGQYPEVADIRRYVMLSGSPYARYLEDPAVTLKKLRILARRLYCEAEDNTSFVENEILCLRNQRSAVLQRRLVGLNGDLLEASRSLDDAPDDDRRAPDPQLGRQRTLLLGTVPDESFFSVDRLMKKFAEPENLLTRWLKSQGVRDPGAFLHVYEEAPGYRRNMEAVQRRLQERYLDGREDSHASRPGCRLLPTRASAPTS
ncbi:hypothetical protein V5799_017546 [Amblyomma americanum]|uniref:Carboxylesterase type B domain-containing protein n=1 Tax=Amblyomma americanum TaxID=6943 RepID=A0AAQ4F2Z2_AMBAM